MFEINIFQLCLTFLFKFAYKLENMLIVRCNYIYTKYTIHNGIFNL